VQLANGREVPSHVVLLAPGVQYRKLTIPGAERLTGRGIYYGAALVEAVACKDEEVFIVGGANSAGQAALHFAQYACKVTMLVRGEGLSATMSKYLIDEIERTSNIVLEPKSQVLEAYGEERLEGLKLQGPAGDRVVPATSLFVFIGAAPGTNWLPASILRDENGFVLAGEARAFSAGVKRAGRICGGRCAARIGKAGGVGGGRGVDRGAVCAPVPGGILRARRAIDKDGMEA
jgi:thioredoxin reductase (NADPH)